MRLVPRLIPTVIVATTVILTMRVGALWHDAGIAMAQTPAAAPAASPAPASAATGDAAKPATPPTPAAPPAAAKFSPEEVQLLQELSKRRVELDQRSEDLDRRELLLKAAEQQVDEKIAKLQQLQTQVDAQLGKAAAQDDDRLKSLVKIYETMKPDQAAAIFAGMDMPVLLQLVTRMKDKSTADILGKMTPEKARAVTTALEQRTAPTDPKTN
jgi:flagellar motility protein MotE (MotC chaperone)